MSQNEKHEGHESPIKTPKQLITVVAIAFLAPIAIIVLLSQFVANMRHIDPNSAEMAHDAVAKRLKPVGDVAFAESGTGAAAAGPKSGEDVFKAVCSACHASGAAGAPKLGDKSDWAQRIKKGDKMLIRTAIKGIRAMPPRGGAADLSDLEVARAVVFMANKAGANFKDPAAPAAAPAAAAKVDGKKVYEGTCVVCHGAGVAGAPKAGDKAAWAPRLKAGIQALYGSALKGKAAMPPKGGNAALNEAEVKAAVDYLAGLAK